MKIFCFIVLTLYGWHTAFAQSDADSTKLVVNKGLFEFGGGLSLSTSAVRNQGGGNPYNPPQSRFGLIVQPEVNYFFSRFISGGIRIGLDYLAREDLLPSPRGAAVLARQNNFNLTFGLGVNAYQGVLRRFYLYERLGFDFGTGSVKVNLLDANDQTVTTSTLNTGITRLVPELGLLFFVRNNVALKAMLAYQVSFVTVSAFDDPGNDINIWLPTGNYLEQGLLFKVGLSFFFKAPINIDVKSATLK